MQRDLRHSVLYQEAESLYRAFRGPASGQISDASELHCSPDGRYAVFAGTVVDALEGLPRTRICRTELATGDTRVLSFGPHTDRLPKFSPAGRQIAFLSDRHCEGDYQLYLLDPVSGAARPAPRVEGWVEYLHWSHDGRFILLGAAGHGADVAGGQGAVTSKQTAEPLPGWMPSIETGNEHYRWRRVWIYELAADRVWQVDAAGLNVWEAAWCGNDALVAVASPDAGEGSWYTAHLYVIRLATGATEEIHAPADQLGWPTGSPSGEHIAVIEALCSDRGIVAGELCLIDTASGAVERIDTHNVDITYAEWRSDRKLLLAGHRGPETVIVMCDAGTGACTELWSSHELTTGGRYVTVSGFGASADCALVGEGQLRAPEVAVIRAGEYKAVKSFDLGYAEHADAVTVTRIRWEAHDGLDIQGWLLLPKGDGPYPLIMSIHGGPVFHWRPTWLGRWGVHHLMLVRSGYAVFMPNPRGSAGCGQQFARKVLGDMGGADAQDLLCGIDHLVRRGIADSKRLGVTGVSYGGFMSAWLITQDPRFAAAVVVSPVTNQVTEHLISNIPHFTTLFLADRFNNPGGRYFERSPVMHAHKARTPTLNICGALDRCTPPEEAVQFHNALLQNGVTSVLVTYPQEGHGVRQFPAIIDYAARLVGWFQEQMPAAVSKNSAA